MRSLENDFTKFEAEGTVFGSISSKYPQPCCIIPAPEVVHAFEWIAGPLDDRIEHNEFESRTLAALRDTLLPKLISGEVRVKSGADRAEGNLVMDFLRRIFEEQLELQRR